MFSVIYTPATTRADVQTTTEWEFAAQGLESESAAVAYVTDQDQRPGAFVILDHSGPRPEIAATKVRTFNVKDV